MMRELIALLRDIIITGRRYCAACDLTQRRWLFWPETKCHICLGHLHDAQEQGT